MHGYVIIVISPKEFKLFYVKYITNSKDVIMLFVFYSRVIIFNETHVYRKHNCQVDIFIRTMTLIIIILACMRQTILIITIRTRKLKPIKIKKKKLKIFTITLYYNIQLY